MKLVVPYLGELRAADARLLRIAEFLGIASEPLRLEKHPVEPAAWLENSFPSEGHCLLVNPRLWQEWLGGEACLPALTSSLTARFPYLLVHAPTLDRFCADLVTSLSGGRLSAVEPVADAGELYEMSAKLPEVCEAFSGISFGPVNPAHDRTFAVNNNSAAGELETAIAIGGRPFLSKFRRGKSEIVFLASADALDVNEKVGNRPLAGYFSRFVPQAMALRHIFGDACWRPSEPHASIIIDDPLLQPKYGFLDFDSLLRMMQEHHFSTTLAFIPHNYRRHSTRVVQMFRDNPERLALCFHGNDHTAGELASHDWGWLNTVIGVAEIRMKAFRRATDLPCSRVMVFPQGRFSVKAMQVLKQQNFCAAVNNTPHPTDLAVDPTAAELAQPALLRWGGFPLFLRRSADQNTPQDIAFNLFFGRPVLIMQHHDDFRDPGVLANLVSTINTVAPEMRWCDVETAVTSSVLRRKTGEGVCQVRAYAGSVRIANRCALPQPYSVEWNCPQDGPPVEQILQNGIPTSGFEVESGRVRAPLELAPGEAKLLSLVYRHDGRDAGSLGAGWRAKAFVRRRLSELRDNYLSKNPTALATAKLLQRTLFGRNPWPQSPYE